MPEVPVCLDHVLSGITIYQGKQYVAKVAAGRYDLKWGLFLVSLLKNVIKYVADFAA